MAGAPTGEVGQFVEAFARKHGLDPQQKFELMDRTRRTLAWINTFRRAIGVVRSYDVQHPSAVESIETLSRETQSMHEAFGAITIRLAAGGVTTEEGFSLRSRAGRDTYVLFPLYRDGVVRLQLQSGIDDEEIRSLLRVIAADGHREGDDAVTWLWSGRHAHLRIDVVPTYAPIVAETLHRATPDDYVLGAFVAVLRAAAPDHEGADRRAQITRAHAASLGEHDVDAVFVNQVLDGGPLDERFVPPSEQTRAECRALFADDQDRKQRNALIRRRFAPRGRNG